MKPEKTSQLSIVVNIVLTGLKLFVGSLTASMTLIADGLHSGLDILSSGITYLSIKQSNKPADKDHPYGHEKFESLAAFTIVIFLSLSAFLILTEAIESLIKGEALAQIGISAFLVVLFSAVMNVIIAKLKVSVGKKHSSKALIADGGHSHADAISSFGILAGLFLIHYYPIADSIIAILVSFFIFYQSYKLGIENIAPLVDESDPEMKKKIKDYLDQNEISFSAIKTRKSGASSFAEIHINPDPEKNMRLISKKNKEIKNSLEEKFPRLKRVIIVIS